MPKLKKTAALLLLAATLLSALLLTACGKKEEAFFLDEKMSDYISLNRADYLNVALTVDGIPEITDADVEKYILEAYSQYLVSKNKTTTQYDGNIKKGDTVKIWYRGEMNVAAAGESERWIDFIGGCNFYPASSTTSPQQATLTVGGSSFIEDFQNKLVTLTDIGESSFKTVVDEKNHLGMEGLLDIVHVTYSYEYKDKNGNRKNGQMYDRVDLRKDEGGNYLYDSRYSDALRDSLAGVGIGYLNKTRFTAEHFDITGDLAAEDITIWNMKVVSIVKEDKPLKTVGKENLDYSFEAKFPDAYPQAPELAGKTARWYVYATEIVRPDTVKEGETLVLTYGEVVDALGITYDAVKSLMTAAEITEAEKSQSAKEAAVVAHYKEYIKKGLEAEREQTLQADVIDGLWRHIIDKVEINEDKWPEDMVDRYIESLYASAEESFAQFIQQNGSATFGTLEEYVVNQYTEGDYFTTVDKVAEGFRHMAEDQLKQEMAVYYIADAEGLRMSEGEEEKYYRGQLADMIEYYNTAYAEDIKAGKAEPFTESDLVDYGYTKQTVVSNYYYEQVSLTLYDGMVENNTITYDLPAETN